MKYEWNVVYTHPQCERKAFEALTKKSINAYLPCYTVSRQWSDRKKKINVPMFPNYLFVYVSKLERHHVLNVDGITRFISFDGTPASISDDEIRTIKLMIDGDMNPAPESYFVIGDHVRVIGGPLAGMEGMLIEKKGTRRLFIRFHSVSQAISVDVQHNLVQKIQPAA
jgi:transcription antitermination factor NusG